MTRLDQQLQAERWMPTRFGADIGTDYAARRNLERLIAEAEYAISKES